MTIFLLPLPFIAIGCIIFWFCTALTDARRFALAGALWSAAFGGVLLVNCIVAILLFVGMDKLSERLHANVRDNFAAGPHPTALLAVIIGIVLISAAETTLITMFHGFIIRRMTYPLFRLYVTAVAFGISVLAGSYFGLMLATRLHLAGMALAAVASLVALIWISWLTWTAYARASNFRGPRPETLNPIAPTEYSSL